MLKQPWYKKSSIQDFGYLISADFSGLIHGLSSNISDILPHEFNYYLGKSVAVIHKVLFTNYEDLIQEALSAIHKTDYIRKIIAIEIHNQAYYLSIYRDAQAIFYELERKTINTTPYLAYNDLPPLLSVPNEELWQNLSDKTAQLLGFHKTIIFKINDNESGTVCAETNTGDYKSSMALHFSKEFISPEIINYYKKSTARFCFEVHSEGNFFYTTYAHATEHQHTHLAPFPAAHLAYLKEIGVKSSLVVPIIINKKCWGLLIASHFDNKWVDLHHRQICSLMVQFVANTFDSSLKQNLLTFHKKIKEFELNLKGQLLVQEDINSTLAENIQNLAKVIHAEGVAIVQQDHFHRYGLCPSESQLIQLIQFIKKHKDKRIFKDHNFSLKHQSHIEDELPFAGLLCLRLNKYNDHYIIWFRKEKRKDIIQISTDDDGLQFSSNKDFVHKSAKIWINSIFKSAEPWNTRELYLVNRIFKLIQEIKILKSEEQEKVNHEVISLNNELEMLTFTLSHDIKNPLSIVKMGSQMLQRNTNMTNTEIIKWSSTIQEASQSIENLVGSSIAFTQARSYVFKKTKIQMVPILRKVVNESRLLYEKNACSIVWGTTLPIYGERNLLYQIFLNLIGNAIKYSANTESPRIEITSTMDDKHVIYTISDNGIGIPKSDLPSIFEIFKRSNNAQHFKGSGVGLALVKRILDRLSSYAEIQSIENEGTTIHLYFPKSKTL